MVAFFALLPAAVHLELYYLIHLNYVNLDATGVVRIQASVLKQELVANFLFS
jgi:hypothetical protein